VTFEPLITQASASGKVVCEVMDRLQPIIETVPRPAAIMATLSIAILLMDPFISSEDLVKCVRGTSEFICMAVSGLGEDVEVGKLN
jgi:hypothetical protein